MTAIVSLLRGVNLGGHRKIKMDELRKLYDSLGLQNVQTLLQSGNVVFSTRDKIGAPLAKRIEDAIEHTFGFHSGVILRTSPELRDVIAKNPFAKRPGIEPSKFLVWFLAADPGRRSKRNPERKRGAARKGQGPTDQDRSRGVAGRRSRALHLLSQRNGAAEDFDGAD
jgi:hypothetical protein